MSLVQALAIAAAAFVTSLSLNGGSLPYSISDHADRQVARAIERAQQAEFRAAAWEFDNDMSWETCGHTPKRGRI